VPKLPGAALEVVSTEGLRKKIPLSDRAITLGRSLECDVVIDDPCVSSVHARIEPVEDGYVLCDAGSTNGTWVDGAPVAAGRKLAHGATVVLGRPGKYGIRYVAGGGGGRPAPERPAGERPGEGARPILLRKETLPEAPEAAAAEEEAGATFVLSAHGAAAAARQILGPRPVPARGAGAGPAAVGAISAASSRNLQEVLEISKALLSTLDLEPVLGRVLDACLRIAHAERGYLFLLENGSLRIRASRDEAAGEEARRGVEFSRTIATRVAASGQAEFLSDAGGPAPVDKSASVVRLRLRTVACVPLQIQQRVIGIVYLDSSRPAVMPDQRGREVVEVLAGLAAVAIENARLVRERVESERWSTIGRVAASIVHDIRGPLTAVRGRAELLAEKVPDPEHREKLKAIIAEVDRLSGLAGEMMELTVKARPLRRTPTDLTALLREFAGVFEGRLEKAGIRLAIRTGFEGALPLDREKMMRLLHNLAGNAVEAMQPGGTLTLETSLRDGKVALVVADTGCGMDATTSEHVFEPFFSRGKEDGTGLGLAIVRRIAEQHDATIAIDTRPGEGTRIEILFPPPAPDPAAR
jgi:signal transduction histidine kinase